MKLSLRKALSLVVVSAMLLAALAVSVFAAPPAIASDIKLTSANNASATTDDIIVWASANADDTAPANYNWWYKALLEYSDETKTFDVIETEAMGQDASVYTTWKLGYGRIVIMAHDTNTADTASFSAVSKLTVGKKFFFVGDYDEVLAATGAVTVTLAPTEPVGGGYWVKPYKHTFTDGFNIYGDTNTKIFKNDAVTGLVDGNWVEDADAHATEGVYLIQNIDSANINTRPVVTLAYKYAEATAIDTIKIGFYAEFASMVGLPENDIVISTSEDGDTWTEVATLQHGLTLEGDINDLENAEKGTKIATLTLEEAVTATYIKADLVYATSPFPDKVVWEFIALTEVEFSLAPVEEEPAAPDYSEKPIWVTHYNDETKEGAGVIITTEVTNLAWRDHYAFAPVEGTNNVFELVDTRYYLGTNTNLESIAVPAGGFVYSLNTGNNYPALGMDGLDYTTTACADAIAFAATWEIGDKFYFYGVDLEGLTVPTSTPDVNWYEEGENEDAVYVCTATVTPYVSYDETETIDEATGDYAYGVANGYTFNINYVDGTIVGEDNTIITTDAAYATCNPNWAISVLLSNVEGNLYTVERVVVNPGSAAGAGITLAEGQIILVAHSAYSNPNGTNYQSKIAAMALKAGDKVAVSDTEVYVLMPGEIVEAPKTDLGKIEDADAEVGVYGEDSPVTNLNGDVFVFAAGDEDRVVTSDEANLRYSWLLVVDAEGKVVQIGNNLVKASEGKEGFQNDVTVPAGGFLVAFVYNATDANYNEELMNFYNELVAKYNDGTAIYNETIAVDSDYYLGVNAARDTLYLTYGEPVEGGGESEAPVEPGDASNMLVFAILALVAIAGSAVVIKTRK